jgi:hypothetical protein
MKRVATSIVFILLLHGATCNYAEENPSPLIESYHFGLLASAGTDIIGKEIRSKIIGGLYSFYGYGFPSFVTGGFSYYGNINKNGIVLTAGIALGAPSYTSVSYKWRLDKQHFFELGVGYAEFFASKGYYPVIAYEHRL